MKRTHPTSDTRRLMPGGADSDLESELSHGGDFNRQLPAHRAISQLAARRPSETFAQQWRGLDPMTLLQECNNQDWVSNFGHIARLFGMTALTHDISAPAPQLITHLLLNHPQVVDMALNNFCADVEDKYDLEKALSGTQHLQGFHLVPEDMDPGVGQSIVQGLRSHHQLTSWRHWTDDEPDTIAPELVRTLSCMPNLRRLALSIDDPWQADHFEQLAGQLMLMPALQELHLSLVAGCDLSSFFQSPEAAGEAWSLNSLKVDIAPASKDATRNTAKSLLLAIPTLRRMTSLCLPRQVFNEMRPDELIRAIRQNGVIDTLTFLNRHGDDVLVDISDGLAAALQANRNSFHLSSIGEMNAACSAFVNVILATNSQQPVSDIGVVLATHLVGHSTAPDLRDCQGMLRAWKPVWNAARDARRAAMLQLLAQPSTDEAALRHRRHLVGLGRKYGILSVEEAAKLAERHSNWLRRQPPALQ